MTALSRRTAKQVLAFGTLLGFCLVTAAVMLDLGGEKIDLVFGAWIGLITKVMSDYFGEQGPEQAP